MKPQSPEDPMKNLTCSAHRQAPQSCSGRPVRALAACLAALLAAGLSACLSGGTSDAVTVSGDVPIAYAQRPNTALMDPLGVPSFAAGGDLMIRDLSSASAPEHNVTAAFTQGAGDVSGPEVSWDGSKIVFAMRCPATNTSQIGGAPACTDRWNIWEYDMTGATTTTGTFRRLTASTQYNDIEPAYLPSGAGFVFTSDRQTGSLQQTVLGQPGYPIADEYERQRVFNLHTMDASGGSITQISFNQSHDRNPVVRPDGTIMYSRWEHQGDRNRFAVFTAKPDGTGMFILYGDHNGSVNSFLHPRDMDPAGPWAGYLASDAMPLRGTQEGGALMLVDAKHYSEENTPADSSVPLVGGQVQATTTLLNLDRGISLAGRVTTPFPLWDGTNRILVSYAPCEVMKGGALVSCATLTSAEIARLTDPNRLQTAVNADPIQVPKTQSYAVYMFNPKDQTWRIVAAPPVGFMNTKPVPLQARTQPTPPQASPLDPALAAAGLAVLEVRSVYDTDALGRMGDPILAPADLPSGCTTSIAKVKPSDPKDTRALVADLASMKDPANAAYRCAPASVLRVQRAVPPQIGMTGLRDAIGQTNFEMQQLLGYVPIQPDGSVKFYIPADTPVAFTVIDAQGRSFQVHTNWIQARAGEKRTCDGCHGPRRSGALNSPPLTESLSNAILASMRTSHLAGETMADTAARLAAPSGSTMEPAFSLTPDPQFTDVWADTSQPGILPRTPVLVRYTGNGAGMDLTTTVPANGVINYTEHIQPLWERDRGGYTCVGCHADPAKLDLQHTPSGTGRFASYEKLLVGDPLIDPVTGLPVTQIEDGVPVVVRKPALVQPTGSEGDAIGMARKSRLVEILSGQALMASAQALAAHPNPPASPNHATMLNLAENRLLAEWIDLGAKYFNDPFNPASGVTSAGALSSASGTAMFEASVEPILMRTCAVCHQPVGSNQGTATASFALDRFVLTGDPRGDLNVTLTMITDTCNPVNNELLSRPSGTSLHPPALPVAPATVSTGAPVLPSGSPDYVTISNWIASGRTAACP
jgi:hypothetical protein